MSQIQCTFDHTKKKKKEVDVCITFNLLCLFRRGGEAGRTKNFLAKLRFICMCMLRNGCGLYAAPACDCHSYGSWLMWSESLHTAVELKSPSRRKIERPSATQVADGAGGT